MKKYLFSSLLVALFAIGFTASDDEADLPGGGETPLPPEETPTEVAGIVKITDAKLIGDWDAVYLTKFGYFTYSDNVSATGAGSRMNTGRKYASGGESNFCAITYMSTDEEEMATLIATKDENLPTQLIVKDQGIVYFSFPNDSIVELLYDDTKTVQFLGSYLCRKSTLPSFTDLDKTDVFRAALANAAALIDANTSGESIKPEVNILVKHFSTMFGEISKLGYEVNEDAVAELPVYATGQLAFTVLIRNWYQTEIVLRVYNTISLWTGKATFKVGGSSCTLSGSIWCTADIYNALGTYGIVCDADPEKLVVGEGGAEYQGEGLQPYGKLSYDVDFRGLKPNTTYYYRAYYKFNDFADHGTLIPRYGQATDQVLYDTTIKSFTTGDNLLSVDVVMCIDYTGSMSDIINTVKNNAMTFYDSFKAKCDEMEIGLTGMTAQVIGFQDKNVDIGDWFRQSRTFQLPDEREAFNSFVGAIYAKGGGDWPESGLEALDAAFSKADWGIDDGFHRQIVILWTDAPFLIGSSYTDLTVEDVKAKWDAMPSGRRMILFAPSGAYTTNGGDWQVFDSWKNVIHVTELGYGFSSMDYILEQVIGELTSKSRMASKPAGKTIKIVPRPNY